MRTRVAAAALTLLAALPLAAAAQDAAAVAPESYKKTLDNERVRVFEVTIKKGAAVAMHSHPDHVVYVLSGGTLEFTLADGSKHSKEAKSGQTFFIPAEAHSLTNVGKSVVKLVSTELKESAPTGALSAAERSELLELFERGQRELEELVASTPEDLWAQKPAPERWSVSEVVEHLGAAEGLLFGMLQQALAAPASSDWALVEGGMSTEGFLGMLQDRSKKFQAPEPIQPKGGLSRADALAKFAGARAVSAEFVRRTTAPVKKHLVDGPAGKMTAHQMLVLLGGHNLRHNAQIREALEVLQKK
ncbi:MAG: DinB family protein [Thermoanaerobaculia bacterium]|jgi:quercetin dioxygenase-like cupin family protein|nr:DinB family protein [Thermoanaerobaculia bacterium]